MNSPPVYDNSQPAMPPHSSGAQPGVHVQYNSQGQISGPFIYVGGPQQPYQYRNTSRVYENYLSKQSLGLGVTMIMSGCFCIIFNSVTIALGGGLSPVAYGIWGGIWFILTGSFGISAAAKKTPCMVCSILLLDNTAVVTFMVLAILCSAISLAVFVLSAISAAVTTGDDYVCGSHDYYRGGSYDDDDFFVGSYDQYYSNECQGAIALESLQSVLAFVVGIASIWGSVLCCKVACCCSTPGQVLVPASLVPVQGTQQVVFYPQQLQHHQEQQQQQQQQQQQFYPYPGPYPAAASPIMYPGYTSPMMIHTEIEVASSGHVNHSVPVHPSVCGTGHSYDGILNPGLSTSDPPLYDNENKSGM